MIHIRKKDGISEGNGYDDNRRGFGRAPREDDEYHVPDPTVKKTKLKKEEVQEQAPVAPVPDRKYIKGTPENKAYKATKKTNQWYANMRRSRTGTSLSSYIL